MFVELRFELPRRLPLPFLIRRVMARSTNALRIFLRLTRGKLGRPWSFRLAWNRPLRLRDAYRRRAGAVLLSSGLRAQVALARAAWRGPGDHPVQGAHRSLEHTRSRLRAH